MELYHFSDESSIKIFVPRAVEQPGRAEELNRPLVWAIDEWHSPMYLFPRDCPRILLWPLPTTTAEDRARWWGARTARMIACVEWAWLERIQTTTLYRYTFAGDAFESLDDAGMWVSRGAVRPLAVAPLDDLLGALRAAEVELRVMESLLPLRGVWETSLHASGIRLRNAEGWV